MANHIKVKFKDHLEADFSYSISGVGRFRVNAYIQRGTVALVFRAIPYDPPALQTLNLPQVIEKSQKKEGDSYLLQGQREAANLLHWLLWLTI